ncbi:helix-turn-helix transcriptional regulator [Embleya sp. NPDC005971]|uniref:helix-turn-helix domain-containing protein n=1 Tax=Embleya sp. NPDC005971 TaxID=3156724 RepID=UPI00340873CC
MNAQRGITRCAACGRRFAQRMATGRKRLYCDPTCRRRAQRARERERGAPAPVGPDDPLGPIEPSDPSDPADPQGLEAGIVAILRRVACALEEAERTREPLRVRLAYADRLSGETRRYRAVVGEAHPAARIPPRPQWSAQLAARLGARAHPGADAGRDEDLSSAQYAGERLAAALRELRRVEGITVADLAWQAGISEGFLDRILAGEVWASWPVVETLVGKLDGDAHELRALWECSRGIDHGIRRELRDLVELLAAMLRGLWLAAGRPAPELLGAPPLTADAPARILAGALIPDRAGAEVLAERLGAHPDVVRRLWTQVHYGVLIRLGDAGFPAGGLAFGALGGPGPGGHSRAGEVDPGAAARPGDVDRDAPARSGGADVP